MQKKCYFGCNFNGPLHSFPSLHYPQDNRFNMWKSVLSEDVKSKGNYYIHGNVRFCGRHFEQKYKTRGNRLTANSVPTLYLLIEQVQMPISVINAQYADNINSVSVQVLVPDKDPQTAETSNTISAQVPHAMQTLKNVTERKQKGMDHFIKTIKSYPCLWNTETEAYKTNSIKAAAWRQVVKECQISDVREARHLWKKLRDGFRQALRKKKLSDQYTTQWKYQHKMEFLLPHMKSSNTNEYVVEGFESSFQPESDNESQHSLLSDSEPVNKKRKHINEVNIELLKSETEESCTERDILSEEILVEKRDTSALKVFFDSMSGMCKSLPEYQQIQVQRAVFNIVMDAREENVKRTSKP